MTNKPETPATQENLTLAQRIIADKKRWEIEGKKVTVTLETPDDKAAANAIRAEIQDRVQDLFQLSAKLKAILQ